jgi:hypothetical protein
MPEECGSSYIPEEPKYTVQEFGYMPEQCGYRTKELGYMMDWVGSLIILVTEGRMQNFRTLGQPLLGE